MNIKLIISPDLITELDMFLHKLIYFLYSLEFNLYRNAILVVVFDILNTIFFSPFLYDFVIRSSNLVKHRITSQSVDNVHE